jgi:hypothetical protein
MQRRFLHVIRDPKYLNGRGCWGFRVLRVFFWEGTTAYGVCRHGHREHWEWQFGAQGEGS